MTSTPFLRHALRGLLPLCLAVVAAQAPALQLGIQLNPDRVRPGEAIIALITVTNDSAAPLANLSLQARMPAAGVNTINQAYLSGGANCGGNCSPNELVNWTIGLLAPGAGVTVSMPMTVSAGTADGTVITVPAAAYVNAVQQATVQQSVSVDADNALMLGLDADKDGAAPGEQLVYTLSYGNRSTAAVSGTSLSLPLPAGSSFVSASGGGVHAAGVVSWNLGTLQAGQSGRQQVLVNVGAGLGSGALLAIDQALLAGSSAVTGAEQARASLLTRVQSNPVLGLAYAVQADPVRPGEALRATLTASNRSNATIFGAVLRARMPTEGVNVINQVYLSGGANCGGNCSPYDLVGWNLGSLAPGASVTVSLPATVTAGFASGRLIGLQAELRADGVPMAVARHTVANDADGLLALALDGDKDSVMPGEPLRYTLSYGNRGTSSSTGTSLRLPLPPGTSFVSASDGGTHVAGVVTWNLGTLPAGQSGRRQVAVNVGAGLASGTLLRVNAAALSGSSAVTGSEQSRAGLVTRVEANPVLDLSYASNPDPARPGEALRTTLTVANRSDQTVFGTALRARMPTEGVNVINQVYLSGGANCGGNCSPYDLVGWTIGTLAPGAAVTVSLPAPVSAGLASGRLIAQEAEVRADGVPMMTARHTVAVDPDGALALAVNADKDAAAPGERVLYSILYGNRGSSALTGATLSFPLPEGALLSSAGGGTLSGNRVSWQLGTLLAGSGGKRVLSVNIPASAPPHRRLLVDAAELSATSAVTGLEQARASHVTRIVPLNPLKLTLALQRNPVAAGQPLTAILRVRNVGAVPLLNVTVQSRMPPEGANVVNQALMSPPANCGGNCSPYDLVTWSLGTLQPGGSMTLTMPLTVPAGFSNGRLIAFEARAVDDAADLALAGATALVGSGYADSDGDGIADALDNCSAVSNPGQEDADGDGYGNLCDADVDNNGIVNALDLARFRAAFGTSNPEFDLDGNGIVNALDLARFRALFGAPPGPSGVRP
ncbi:thrombospondin type 3 repeat-containing protein [Roseateles violae]|uniref:thrombospondin type 3 repeat-containing protein n=1 Tax=Roseateles violae TaxID=3058042 RepID=UPI003D9C7371